MSFFRGACFEVRGEMCVLGSSGAGSRSDAEFFRGVYAHLCKSGLGVRLGRVVQGSVG